MNDASKGFIKAALILLIIFGVIYIIGYKNWENTNFDDIDYSDYMEKPQLKEDEKISLEKVKQLYSKVNYKLVQDHFGQEFLDVYYNNGIFDDKFMIYLAVININKDNFLIYCNNEIELSKNEIDKKIKELFGIDVTYQDTTFINKDKSLSIEYDSINNKYKVKNNKCSGTIFGEGHIETEYLNYKEENNRLEITEYVYYIDYVKDDSGRYILNYYASLNSKGNLIAKESLSEKDKKKLPIYKFIFEKDKNNNYVFKKIEKYK